MNNAIEEIKRQYTYAVQPVKFFEARNNQASQKMSFSFLENIKPNGNNPYHPNVTNSGKGGRLDIMG